MAHLQAHGAPVPHVFSTLDGDTAWEDGEWTYEVHEAPRSVDLYGDAISWTPFRTVAHASSAGRALAHLHLASEGFGGPRRKPQPLVAGFTIFAAEDCAAGMEEYFAARPALEEDAAARRAGEQALELLEPFHVQLVPLLPSLPSLWTHNDLHASNLLWSGHGSAARATNIIDFGLADRTNAVHDLAQAIERNMVEWLALPSTAEDGVPVHVDHLEALLAGYESVRPLSDDEAAALAPMTALCHAEFALTEADYFLGALHSEDKARVAFEDYLVGHARWYRSAGGEKFLAAIQRWAVSRHREPHSHPTHVA
jgi:Ser/Thr protein kinase RdoA (MazF antagonist)